MAEPAAGAAAQSAPEPSPTPEAPAADRLASSLTRLATDGTPPVTWGSLSTAFEREAALCVGAAAARLLHEAGRIHEERLGDPASALALYRKALAADPTLTANLGAARRLARALGDAALECEILAAEAKTARAPRDAAALQLVRARLLEEALGSVGPARSALQAASAADPESLAVAEQEAAAAAADGRAEDLARALERCAERAGDPALSAAWLVSASAVEEDRLGRPERAADLALRAFELAPGDPTVRANARRHAERLRRFEALAAILSTEAAAPDVAPGDAALAACALARLYDERLGRPDEALAALEEAHRLAGADPVVLEALARAHESRGDWEAAADALRALAQHVAGGSGDPAEVVAGNLRLAELCSDRLGRTDDAVACFRAVLAIDPGHRGALAALGRMHAAAEDWPRLLETFLAERAAATEPHDRAQRCFKAAEVLEERLDRLDEAVALQAEALALDPTFLAAHQALERLYERTGRYVDLASLLEADLEVTRAPDERIALLFRLARLHEDRLSDVAAAARDCERILELAPEHVVALRTLAGLHERTGRFADLVEVHERLAQLTTEPRKAIALLQRSAEVQEEELRDDAPATATYERILRLDPTHLPALRALGRLYGRAQRWTDLVAMCRAEAEASPSTETAAALQFRIGEILEQRLVQERAAIAAYREVLTLSPAHVGALQALARLYRVHGDWESLIEVLRADAASRPRAERQAALLHEVAEIWETRLADPDRAVDVHQEVLRVAPGFEGSLRALDRLLTERGRWADLARVRLRASQHARGAPRAAALLGAARLLLDRLGDADSAERVCRAALDECPGDPGALLLLSRFPGGRAEARAGLAARLADPHTAAQLLVAAASDPRRPADRAAADLARAAALAPADPVVAPLSEQALRRAGDAPALVAHFAAQREVAPDVAAEATWVQRAGEAWEAAGDAQRALTAHRQSLALAPDAFPALEAVARVSMRLGAWAEARAALQSEGASLRDPELAAAAFARAGDVALARLADPGAAAADWRSALERRPLDAAVAERLATVLRSLGALGELCEVHETQARADRDPERAAGSWTAAAGVALELGDRERALADLARALGALPTCAQALSLRGRVLAEAGRHADAARDLAARLALGGPPAALAPTHLALADLYEGPLHDPPRAVSHVAAVLATEPDHPEALARLARIHRETRNWPAAAAALRRLVAAPATTDGAHRSHLLELADVLDRGFDDPASAVEICERALALAPLDPAALERLSALRQRAATHPGLASAIDTAAGAVPAGPERTHAHVRAARVISDVLGDGRRAAALLRRAVDEDPAATGARAALADLYASTEPALAIEEHRRLLLEDAARVESWRALYVLFQADQAPDLAFVAAGVLRFLQASDPATDGAFLAEMTAMAPTRTPATLTPAEWLTLRHPGDHGPLSELLALVGDALCKAVEFPSGSREKLKGGKPLPSLVQEVCWNVGVEPFAVRRGEGVELKLEPGDPPAVRIGPDLPGRRSVPELRFLLARAAARIRARTTLAARLAPRDLGDLVAAVVRLVVPGYEDIGRPSPALVESVARAIPRKMRKALPERARAVAEAGALDLEAWHTATAASANRVGLLMATDVPAALSLVLREGAGARDVATAVRSRPDLAQLLVFAASEDHFRLRQRLRLAVAPPHGGDRLR
jgi:hypothetical protein